MFQENIYTFRRHLEGILLAVGIQNVHKLVMYIVSVSFTVAGKRSNSDHIVLIMLKFNWVNLICGRCVSASQPL